MPQPPRTPPPPASRPPLGLIATDGRPLRTRQSNELQRIAEATAGLNQRVQATQAAMLSGDREAYLSTWAPYLAAYQEAQGITDLADLALRLGCDLKGLALLATWQVPPADEATGQRRLTEVYVLATSYYAGISEAALAPVLAEALLLPPLMPTEGDLVASSAPAEGEPPPVVEATVADAVAEAPADLRPLYDRTVGHLARGGYLDLTNRRRPAKLARLGPELVTLPEGAQTFTAEEAAAPDEPPAPAKRRRTPAKRRPESPPE